MSQVLPLALLLWLAPIANCHGRHAGLFQQPTDVVEVTPATFDAVVVRDNRSWLMLFYADWCGHCQHYAPTYKKMASSMRKEHQLVFGAVNCAAWNSFCTDKEVRGYPTTRGYHFPFLMRAEELHGADIPRDQLTEGNLAAWWKANRPRTTVKAVFSLEPVAEASSPPMASLRGSGFADVLAATAVTTTVTARPRPKLSDVDAESLQVLHLLDAEVALLYSLHQGPTLVATSGGGGQFVDRSVAGGGELAVRGSDLIELIAWLGFLAQAFPSRRAREELKGLHARVLEATHDGILSLKTWAEALDGRGLDLAPARVAEDPVPFFRLCTTYTCGLWTLFHQLTVAVAEASAALPASQVLVPAEEALNRIRGFVALFFGCDECVRNFLQVYDSCEFGRCQLSPTDGVGSAMWLWQVHNSVTARLAKENGRPEPSPWPPATDCPACWRGGVPNDVIIYAHLRTTYALSAVADQGGFGIEAPWHISNGFWILLLIMVFMCLGVWRRGQRFVPKNE